MEQEKMQDLPDSRDAAVRIFLYCSNNALLRPIANIIRLIQPMAAAHTTTSRMVQKISQDPGLPRPNPTNSFWQTPPDPNLSEVQSYELPTQTNVLIIGSGITAASTAHFLLTQDPNLHITICEARTITSGATGRNGGHIIDLPYEDYEEDSTLLGKGEAQRLARFRMMHLTDLVEFAKTELEEDAAKYSEVRVVETVDAFFDEAQWKHGREQLEGFLKDFPDQRDRWKAWERDEARKKFGMENVFGAISGPAGAIWPYRFITAVYQNLLTRYPGRISIETKTPVQSIKTTPQANECPYLVTTSRGIIQAKNVVHATNGHAAHLLPRLRGKIFPIRGQMTVQSLTGDSAPPNLGASRSWLLRHGKGYDYMTQNPATGDYFLGGGALQGGNGGQDAFGNPSDEEQDFTALCHLRGMLPMMFDRAEDTNGPAAAMKAAWTGTLGFSCDGRPWVGRIPEKISDRQATFSKGSAGGEWISAAFCGAGMVYCWRSGRALASMILGREEDWFPESLRITQERYDSSSAKDVANFWLSRIM